MLKEALTEQQISKVLKEVDKKDQYDYFANRLTDEDRESAVIELLLIHGLAPIQSSETNITPLGTGAFGIVFETVNKAGEYIIAKVMLLEHEDDAEFGYESAIQNEIDIHKNLKELVSGMPVEISRHIVNTKDVIISGDFALLTMPAYRPMSEDEDSVLTHGRSSTSPDPRAKKVNSYHFNEVEEHQHYLACIQTMLFPKLATVKVKQAIMNDLQVDEVSNVVGRVAKNVEQILKSKAPILDDEEKFLLRSVHKIATEEGKQLAVEFINRIMNPLLKEFETICQVSYEAVKDEWQGDKEAGKDLDSFFKGELEKGLSNINDVESASKHYSAVKELTSSWVFAVKETFYKSIIDTISKLGDMMEDSPAVIALFNVFRKSGFGYKIWSDNHPETEDGFFSSNFGLKSANQIQYELEILILRSVISSVRNDSIHGKPGDEQFQFKDDFQFPRTYSELERALKMPQTPQEAQARLDAINEEGRLDTKVYRFISAMIGLDLHYEIRYRDLHSGNVMIDKNTGEYVAVDVGLFFMEGVSVVSGIADL